jgi:hypothetical protein
VALDCLRHSLVLAQTDITRLANVYIASSNRSLIKVALEYNPRALRLLYEVDCPVKVDNLRVLYANLLRDGRPVLIAVNIHDYIACTWLVVTPNTPNLLVERNKTVYLVQVDRETDVGHVDPDP